MTTGEQPSVHDLSVSVNGNVTALSAGSGDMGSAMAGASGAEGVYVDDRRVVSVLTVRLGTKAQEPLANASSGRRSDFLSCARGLADSGADATVQVCRHREVGVQGIAETVEITSRAGAVVETDLVLSLGGDGAPIALVKSGAHPGPLLAAESENVIGGARRSETLLWRDEWHRTGVSFDPAPTSVTVGGAGEASAATFHLSIEPGQAVSVVATIHASRLRESCFDANSGAARVDWGGVSIRSADPRLEPTVRAGLDDLQHLLMSDPQDPTSIFAAAGTPWYLTLFGRDSLWAARMALPLGTELAAGTLRALARRQGSTLDEDSGQAPGKIPHEVRRTDYVDPSAGPALPPVYYFALDRPVPYPAACRPQAWSAASAAVLISVALGFDPDAPAGRLTLRPARPAAYGGMTVAGLRFAGRSFGVRCEPDGGTEVVDAPDDVDIVIR